MTTEPTKDTPETPPIIYRYVGQGFWYPHIPARDLLAADVASLSDADRAWLEASDVYEAVAPAKRPKATKED